eukprot:scaffold76103_cov28-Phaeocystis_antarctica.AAC.1
MPAGMTCDAGVDWESSSSSTASTATRQIERSSFMMVKLRATAVKTEMVPKSIVLGPPVTMSSSLGESGCLHSRSSSAASGRGLNLHGKRRVASKMAIVLLLPPSPLPASS